jgi:hypothetical protein
VTIVDLSAGLLKKFMEFTKKLTPEQLASVVTGELKFGLLHQPSELEAGLSRKWAEFTKKLTPEQLADVAIGQLKFGLLGAAPKPSRQTPSKKAPVEVDIPTLSAELERMTSREVAAAHLDGLGVTATRLKEIAKALGVSLTGVSGKDAVRDRIVEHKVGYRLNSQTIRHGSWSDEWAADPTR